MSATDAEQSIQVLNIPRGVLQAMVRQVIVNELGGARQAVKDEISRMVQKGVDTHLPKATADVQKRTDGIITWHVNRQLGGWTKGIIEDHIKHEVARQVNAVVKERLANLKIALDLDVGMDE